MIKRILAVIAAFSAVMLSGCSKDISDKDISDSDDTSGTEMLFDYFSFDDMPSDETKEFELPEFPDVKFIWAHFNMVSEKNGEKTELFSGMPIWSVYLFDLNGDGKREICSEVSMGSGITDDRIIVCDYANSALYELQDRLNYDFRLELKNGVLYYRELPRYLDGKEHRFEPLSLDQMTKIE